MERAGAARKVTDRDDARIIRVHATPKGLRALARGRAMRIEAIEQLMKELEAEELSSIERAVRTIEKLLGQRAASARR
jgi:DNA-binding MarR family transcriptional regulator